MHGALLLLQGTSQTVLLPPPAWPQERLLRATQGPIALSHIAAKQAGGTTTPGDVGALDNMVQREHGLLTVSERGRTRWRGKPVVSITDTTNRQHSPAGLLPCHTRLLGLLYDNPTFDQIVIIVEFSTITHTIRNKTLFPC